MTDEQKQTENEIDNAPAVSASPALRPDEAISSLEEIASVNAELPRNDSEDADLPAASASTFAEASVDQEAMAGGRNDKVRDERLVNFDELRPGQTVRVHERIVDVSPKGEERQRIQMFEGIILGIRGAGISKSFTIRKVSGGIGVEKIFPINSPVIAKIELVKTARVRRAKLSFLNNLKRRFKRKLKETYAE